MIKTEQTMRWYGPQDTVSLRDIRQAGVTGIVTALHHVPVGAVWTVEAIKKRRKIVREAGLEWTVIESLPIHEDIKRRKGDDKLYLKNYKKSLENIARCGIKVVTYNFMPVLDWVRTDIAFENPDGTRTLLYDKQAFAYFDLFLLKRPNADKEYSAAAIADAASYGDSLSENEKQTLFNTVLQGLPGSKERFTREQVLTLLEAYKDVDAAKLRQNLIHFLSETAPLAQELGIKLALHPDDPPFPVLGLPRVVCTGTDIGEILNAVPVPANGLCYCTGSLGAHPGNDLLQIIDDYGDRIHFLHLRNVRKEQGGIFRESEHLNGDNPMEAIMEKLLRLMQKRNTSLPMRPDHGFLHSIEGDKGQYAGYSLIGRLKGLAELRGLEQGIAYTLKNSAT